MKLLFSILLTAFGLTASAQAITSCQDALFGTFKDELDIDKTAYIVVDEAYFTEYSKDGKEFIKSTIKWQSDCEYELTIQETNIKNFQIPIGTQLRVEILKFDDHSISYEYLPKGVIDAGKLIRIKNK